MLVKGAAEDGLTPCWLLLSGSRLEALVPVAAFRGPLRFLAV